MPLLEVSGLSKSYARGRRGAAAQRVDAVRDVTLQLDAGEILGLVGESGSGKTTTARCIAGLIRPSAGSVIFAGRDLLTLRAAELRAARRHLKMIFQNPYSSLDPRMSVGDIVAEGLVVNKLAASREDRRERVLAALADVGLPADACQRRPREFSGGQRQRIAIARALVVGPRVLICDEVVSSLDVSIQAQICNLLADLRAKRGVAILFIAHDLGVVRQLCHRVAVMSEGSIVETGPTASVLTAPAHAYTQSLVAATPVPDPLHPYVMLKHEHQGPQDSPEPQDTTARDQSP
ncbi:MAG TPA: ATP-binding cassette domain-containing protein [Streptosporangiaceae bacterium]|jgi:ABC-type oligopeptide transport system ATPase subunit